MTRPQAILFDLGETLLHFGGVNRMETFKAGARDAHAFLLERGYRMEPVERFVRRLVGRGRKALLINRLSRREVDIAELFGLVTGQLQRRMRPGDWRRFVGRMYGPLAAAWAMCWGRSRSRMPGIRMIPPPTPSSPPSTPATNPMQASSRTLINVNSTTATSSGSGAQVRE